MRQKEGKSHTLQDGDYFTITRGKRIQKVPVGNPFGVEFIQPSEDVYEENFNNCIYRVIHEYGNLLSTEVVWGWAEHQVGRVIMINANDYVIEPLAKEFAEDHVKKHKDFLAKQPKQEQRQFALPSNFVGFMPVSRPFKIDDNPRPDDEGPSEDKPC